MTQQPDLSPQEKNILSLVAHGIGNKAIGERLYIAESTVNTHLRTAMLKLNAQNKVAAMVMAMDAGQLNLRVIAESVRRGPDASDEQTDDD